MTPLDGFFRTTRESGGVHVYFSGSTHWNLIFTAPHRAPLIRGVYEGAWLWPFQGSARPGLSVTGSIGPYACDSVAGRFVVLEAVYDAAGAVQSFAADYEQHCNGDQPALFGHVRINSSIGVGARLSVDPRAIYEADSGTANLTFTVSLSAPSTSTVTVAYSTADGSAAAGSDYLPIAGALTFPPSMTSRTVIVPILGDTLPESDESFVLNLTSPSNAPLAFGQGTGTILDDEGPRTFLSFNSQPGDFIGQGRAFTLTPLDGDIIASLADGKANIRFDGYLPWQLNFEVPDTDALVPGIYEVPWEFQTAFQSRIAVYGDGRGCSARGRFLILEATLSPGGALQSFAADYEQHCGDATPALFGSVRINSTVATGPRLSVAPVALYEGDFDPTSATFTVSLSAPITSAVTVGYATADGTATAGNDYQPVAGTIAFPPYVTTRSVTVPIVSDTVAEADESFHLDLTAPTGTPTAFGRGTATIVADEGPRTLLYFNSQPGAKIGAGQQFTFTPFDGVLAVNHWFGGVFVYFGNSVEDRWDLGFVAANGATLVPGVYEGAQIETSLPEAHPGLSVTGGRRGCTTVTGRFVVLEAVYDAGSVQKFAADYEEHCNGETAALLGSVRINSSVPIPRVAIDNVTVAEGSSGTTAAVFTVSLSTPSPGVVTVGYTTTDGTAVAGSDYEPLSGTLTFAPGETTKRVAVTVNADAMFETEDTFALTLLAPFGAALANSQGLGTITNDDAPPTVVVGDVGLAEGNVGTRTFPFTVTLSAPSGAPATVNYATQPLTASAGSDYASTSGTLTFAPGETTKLVGVTVSGDATYEEDETFALALSAPSGAAIADAQGLGTIFDEDLYPQLSIDDVTLAEGGSGTRQYLFTVTLSPASGVQASVNYATQDSTALAGSDYVATSGTLIFAPGETTKTLSVTIHGDVLFETNEAFVVCLSGAVDAAVADGIGVGTITNDEATPPSLSIGDVTAPEGNGGLTVFPFSVTLTPASGAQATVFYSTEVWTAAAGSDFQASSGVLTFEPGETTKPIDIVVSGDTVFEQTEAFNVKLGAPTNASIDDGQGVGTITNDDTQASRVFVSTYGVDGNDCSNVLTPCRTFGPALLQVADHGEVIVMNSGSYGSLPTLSRPVKLAGVGGTVVFSASPLTIDAPGPVVLRGLTFKALTPGTGDGVTLQGGGAAFIENCILEDWAVGLRIAGNAAVFVTSSSFRGNDTGILVAASTATLSASNVHLSGNAIGLDMMGGTATVSASTLALNTTAGARVGAGASLVLETTQVTHNTGAGVTVPTASGGRVRLARSVVSGNGVGLDNAGGIIETHQNNVVSANTVDTSGAITPVAQQ